MTPHQTIAVAIRLFAIWLAIYFLRAAPGYYYGSKTYNAPDFAVTFIVVTLAIVAVAFLILWFFPSNIAKGILPAETISNSNLAPVSPDRWFAVGASLLGLWLVADAIPALVRFIFLGLLSNRLTSPIYHDESIYLNVIYYVTELAIGLYLLLGAKGLRSLVMKVRYGAEKSPF